MLSGPCNLIDLPRDDMRTQHIFEKNFFTELNTKNNWNSEAIQYLKASTIKRPTGSHTNRGTATIVFGPGMIHTEAVDLCSFFAILLNSEAAIQALSYSDISSLADWYCHLKLNKLRKNNKVTLIWAPSSRE